MVREYAHMAKYVHIKNMWLVTLLHWGESFKVFHGIVLHRIVLSTVTGKEKKGKRKK